MSGQLRASLESVYLHVVSKACASAVPTVVSRAGLRVEKLVTLSLADFMRLARATPEEQRRIWREHREQR
jgi:hypothetical protein